MTANKIHEIFSLLDILGALELDKLKVLGGNNKKQRKKAVIALDELKSEINKFTKLLEAEHGE